MRVPQGPAEWAAAAWLAVNLGALLRFGADKARARRGRRRVSEAALCAWAAAGGVLGAWVGVLLFRHKTRKRSFQAKLLGASLFGLAWTGWLAAQLLAG
jgi:uncharacterized membrane protein YsdA (DUF1294 family)